MSDSEWETTFERLFQAGVESYRRGERNPVAMFGTRDQAFLGTIGAAANELYDFVEDHCDTGAPDFETALAIAAIRRRYFLEVQHGIPSQFHIDPHELPPKTEDLEGYRWLPRIIAKARAKLRGELDPSIMYGCGGDREFLDSVGMTAPQFLQLIWDAGQDDGRIVAEITASIQAAH